MKTIVLKWDELDKNGRKVFHPTGKRGELKDARPGDLIVQQVNENGQRLTQRELDRLWRDYYLAWDCADLAAGKPWQAEMEQEAERAEQVYMAARFANGCEVTR